MNDTQRRYRYWRSHGHNAQTALRFVRTEQRYRDILGTFGDWEFHSDSVGTVHADRDEAGYTLRVKVWFDEYGTDWGDIEPSDAERENATSYIVAVEVLDGDEEVYSEAIGGIDVIDLDGYLERDWEDAAAYALNEYLLDEAVRVCHNERSEVAYWAARDTITV